MSWGSSDAQTALQNCPPHLPMRQRSCLLYLLLDVERSLVGGGNIPAKLAPSPEHNSLKKNAAVSLLWQHSPELQDGCTGQ